MVEFNLKAGIILRARCLHWKQMDRGRGQQLNAVENVNNVKRHSATQRSNGGSWAVRSGGDSAKRQFRGARLLTWSKWGCCCRSKWLSSLWNRTSWWQTDRQIDRRQWEARGEDTVETVVLLLFDKWSLRKTNREKNASYLGSESLLCVASSVELTYSLTYTNPLHHKPQLGSEVIGCRLYIV